MNSKSQRRRGPDQGNRDAAEDNKEHTPGDAEALAALFTLRAWLGAASAEPTTYTQHRLPPDAKSVDAYKRRHRTLRKAHVPGVWTRGKTLACTPDAWSFELPKAARAKLRIVESSPADALDAALGIRSRGAK